MHFIKSKELELLAQPAELEGSKEVQMQLDRSQERRAHVEHLGRLALSLGVDIISSVQQPVSILAHPCHLPLTVTWAMGCKKQAECLIYVKSELRLLRVVLAIEPRPSLVLTKCSVIMPSASPRMLDF